MNVNLTENAVLWFFNRENCPFADKEKALKICNMRLQGETYRAIGEEVGLSKDRVSQYVARVQNTYDRHIRMQEYKARKQKEVRLGEGECK